VKVALIGQGPDELFGGYTRHLGCITAIIGGAAAGHPERRAAIIAKLPRNETLKREFIHLAAKTG